MKLHYQKLITTFDLQFLNFVWKAMFNAVYFTTIKYKFNFRSSKFQIWLLHKLFHKMSSYLVLERTFMEQSKCDVKIRWCYTHIGLFEVLLHNCHNKANNSRSFIVQTEVRYHNFLFSVWFRNVKIIMEHPFYFCVYIFVTMCFFLQTLMHMKLLNVKGNCNVKTTDNGTNLSWNKIYEVCFTQNSIYTIFTLGENYVHRYYYL